MDNMHYVYKWEDTKQWCLCDKNFFYGCRSGSVDIAQWNLEIIFMPSYLTDR